MSEKPLFETPAQAMTVTFVMVRNLAFLMSWLTLAVLHLLLAVLGLLALWWFQVTPAAVASAARGALESTTLAVAGAVGLSLLGALSAYVAALQWLWPRTFGAWLATQLLSGTRDAGTDRSR